MRVFFKDKERFFMAQPSSKEPQNLKKSPFGTENFERKKPSTLKSLIMTLVVILILVLVGYFFGN